MGKTTKTPIATEPLPDPQLARRPGTSGTELNLRTERRKANSAYQRASRAEQAYRAKKQASTARLNLSAAKAHSSASLKSAKVAWMFFWAGLRALPGVLGEKREARREKREERKKEAAGEKRRRREEKLKAEADLDDSAQETTPEPVVAA